VTFPERMICLPSPEPSGQKALRGLELDLGSGLSVTMDRWN
jgi:hypothetical protein